MSAKFTISKSSAVVLQHFPRKLGTKSLNNFEVQCYGNDFMNENRSISTN